MSGLRPPSTTLQPHSLPLIVILLLLLRPLLLLLLFLFLWLLWLWLLFLLLQSLLHWLLLLLLLLRLLQLRLLCLLLQVQLALIGSCSLPLAKNGRSSFLTWVMMGSEQPIHWFSQRTLPLPYADVLVDGDVDHLGDWQ